MSEENLWMKGMYISLTSAPNDLSDEPGWLSYEESFVDINGGHGDVLVDLLAVNSHVHSPQTCR